MFIKYEKARLYYGDGSIPINEDDLKELQSNQLGLYLRKNTFKSPKVDFSSTSIQSGGSTSVNIILNNTEIAIELLKPMLITFNTS